MLATDFLCTEEKKKRKLNVDPSVSKLIDRIKTNFTRIVKPNGFNSFSVAQNGSL